MEGGLLRTCDLEKVRCIAHRVFDNEIDQKGGDETLDFGPDHLAVSKVGM